MGVRSRLALYSNGLSTGLTSRPGQNILPPAWRSPRVCTQAVMDQAHARPRVFQIGMLRPGSPPQPRGAVIWGSTKAGYPLLTIDVVSGAVMGSGATKRSSAVRWGVAGNIVLAWVDDPGRGGRPRSSGGRSSDLLHADRFGSGSTRSSTCSGRRARRRSLSAAPSSSGSRSGRPADAGGDQGARARGRPVVSSCSARRTSLSMTPYDRDDLITLAFAVDDVADAGKNAAELLGSTASRSPTKQAIELVRAAVRAERASRVAARQHEGPARLVGRHPSDQGDRGPGGRRRACRARRLFKDDRIDPVIVIRWKDIDEALGRSGRRVRDRCASRRQHPRRRTLAPAGVRGVAGLAELAHDQIDDTARRCRWCCRRSARRSGRRRSIVAYSRSSESCRAQSTSSGFASPVRRSISSSSSTSVVAFSASRSARRLERDLDHFARHAGRSSIDGRIASPVTLRSARSAPSAWRP